MPYKNKQDAIQYRKEYYQRNKKKILRQTNAYSKSHRNLINKSARKSMWRMTSARREDVYTLLSPVCRRCGFTDRRALQIDHINGNGKSDRKQFTSQSLYLKHILEVSGEGYQILCANCNWIKRAENREHPERKETYD